MTHTEFRTERETDCSGPRQRQAEADKGRQRQAEAEDYRQDQSLFFLKGS